MTINPSQMLDVIEAMENYIERNRPPEHIREELDIGYKIIDQSIFVFEIRPQVNKPEIKVEINSAKATFVKAKNYWKVFWMKSDMSWHSYPPMPTVKTVKEFVDLIEEDKYCFFWG